MESAKFYRQLVHGKTQVNPFLSGQKGCPVKRSFRSREMSV